MNGEATLRSPVGRINSLKGALVAVTYLPRVNARIRFGADERAVSRQDARKSPANNRILTILAYETAGRPCGDISCDLKALARPRHRSWPVRCAQVPMPVWMRRPRR